MHGILSGRGRQVGYISRAVPVVMTLDLRLRRALHAEAEGARLAVGFDGEGSWGAHYSTLQAGAVAADQRLLKPGEGGVREEKDGRVVYE